MDSLRHFGKSSERSGSKAVMGIGPNTGRRAVLRYLRRDCGEFLGKKQYFELVFLMKSGVCLAVDTHLDSPVPSVDTASIDAGYGAAISIESGSVSAVLV